jgi:hypothetical protein
LTVADFHIQVEERRAVCPAGKVSTQCSRLEAAATGIRAHGLRQAKYRGLAKVKRQNYFIGAACNVKQWLRREAWKIPQAMKAVAAEATGQTAN